MCAEIPLIRMFSFPGPALAQVEYIVSERGTNLLDEEVRYHTSLLKAVAPQPGRSALLSLRVNFD